MKKIFLIIMLFLLPLQYTWAMVAAYDMHDVHDSETHFGHHSHEADLSVLSIEVDTNHPDNQGAKNLDSHLHLGFSHLCCGELVGYILPFFEHQVTHQSTPYLFTFHAPPSYQLERPNWRIAA